MFFLSYFDRKSFKIVFRIDPRIWIFISEWADYVFGFLYGNFMPFRVKNNNFCVFQFGRDPSSLAAPPINTPLIIIYVQHITRLWIIILVTKKVIVRLSHVPRRAKPVVTSLGGTVGSRNLRVPCLDVVAAAVETPQPPPPSSPPTPAASPLST